MRINWLMIIPLAVTLGFFGVAGYQLLSTQGAQQLGVDTAALPSAQQGRAAPPLALEPMEGTPLLDRGMLEGHGDLIMVNFFASWCPPCRTEHPNLTALAEAGVPLFGVNYRDQLSQAEQFLDDLGNPYDAMGRDPEARNGRDWGVVAMPETFFIDDAGVVVLHFRGPITRRSIDNQIAPALAAAGHSLPELPPLAAE
ncbi:Cytochrome c-type biogenesis protein CcmG/DsbE, thiol:disulfide oxidoreductase [Roseibacterium elongatum DSM 19469]|uniref:Cytochrome c-type biogenesis protein CcmG/DsbE, thiol:disulfide oxidoreductase n=1 Tax=Roseicyclus elongatus DSM 19469 TaxID=1294273 RepID=W8RW59_9RHOB|nr:DsbE family thiol:disulfide interchange protein [Roseibacterium elongatum]AHM05543.1 Cytochrome c-type biogenesis protein CcmG/DsbE, thiol:disulfide oxidoreductase [Roseibacterium elongatum DSM 19469]